MRVNAQPEGVNYLTPILRVTAYTHPLVTGAVPLRSWSRAAVPERGCRMSALDFAVIGFGSFVAMIAVGLVVLLAANRH